METNPSPGPPDVVEIVPPVAPGGDGAATAVPAASPRRADIVLRFLRANRKLRAPLLLTLLGGVALVTAALAYLCWFVWMPAVWNWGFDPPTWRAVPAALAAIYLVIGPFAPFALSQSTFKNALSLYVDEQEDAVKATLTQLSVRQRDVEGELEQSDTTGLIPLIRYSRLQLEAYYSIGLGQTQRSFRYSILAMWIGFAVILSGVVLYLLPLTAAPLPRVEGEVHILTLAAGTIIEVISALFLWVYRSSINQLTYFYNRQIHLHNVILCYKIATTMEKPDSTKRLIIERVLSQEWHVDRVPAAVVGGAAGEPAEG